VKVCAAIGLLWGILGGGRVEAKGDEGARALLDRLSAAVVLVHPRSDDEAVFAGVVVGRELVLTSLEAVGERRHAGGPAPEIRVAFRPEHPRGGPGDVRLVRAEVASLEPTWGLALLRVPVPARIAPVAVVAGGLNERAPALAIAHDVAHGLWVPIATAITRRSRDAGGVAGLDLYKLDAPLGTPLPPGASGAPLFGRDGRLEGLLVNAHTSQPGMRPAGSGAVAAHALELFLRPMLTTRPPQSPPSASLDDRTLARIAPPRPYRPATLRRALRTP
jgi:hypothetical protein